MSDPLRQRKIGATVLIDGKFSIRWDGTHLRVEHLKRNVWHEQVCAVDGNVEEVAHAWWTKKGKARVEKFIEHADW